MTHPNPPLGKQLLRSVRARFIEQGTTLGEWCRNNNLHMSNCREALIGSWDGPKAKAVRAKILKAASQKVAA